MVISRRFLVITMCFLFFLNTEAQLVTYCPLNMTSIDGWPLFFTTPSHDVMWVVIRGAATNSAYYACTSDAGASFAVGTIPDLNHSPTCIYALDDKTAWVGLTDFVGSYGGAVWKTTDGGQNWTKLTTTQYADAAAYIDVVCFFNADTGFVLGDPIGGHYEIYTTTDGGVSLSPVPSANIPAPLASEFVLESRYSKIGNKVWCGTNKGRVFYSADRGHTWSVSTVKASLTNMEVSMNDSVHGVACQMEHNVPYITNDGGITWQKKPLSPSAYMCSVNAIKDVPGAFVFKIVGQGIYITDDTFATYSLIDNLHLTGHNSLVMYNTTIGWTQTAYQNFDSAIIKIADIHIGAFSPVANLHHAGIFPNPVKQNSALVSWTLEKNAETTLALYDITGNLVRMNKVPGTRGSNAKVFKFENIASGIYLLSVSDGTNSSKIKVLVE
ncbi:MAG TPA: T9SS type A sorting domain-containing protein [Bacteroidales bacterium]|nr:T9SS type A sorting domain-containing protein [Bacteroidales bacterium]